MLSEHLYRLAMIIHIATFKDNVADTWAKSSRNTERFLEKIEPLLNRYDTTRIDTKEGDQLKKDFLEGTDGKVELIKTLKKFEAIPAREVVKAFENLSPTALKILRNDLTKPYGLFDNETPDTLKAPISKIMKKKVDKDELKSIHDNIKEIIIAFKNPERKKMFQFLVLKPIQVAMGKITPMEIDTVKRNQFLSDLADIQKRKDIKDKYSEKFMLETRTKGVPSSQMKLHTQRLYATLLRKLAHLLIANLQ